MSSELSRFVLSALTLRDTPGAQHLHPLYHLLTRRVLALVCLSPLYSVVAHRAVAASGVGVASVALPALLKVVAFVAFAWWLWFGDQPVFATPSGLEVGAGKRLRFIPWERVFDVRQVPWTRTSSHFCAEQFRVELTSGERFDFVGVRNARDVVIEFVKRSESGLSAGS